MLKWTATTLAPTQHCPVVLGHTNTALSSSHTTHTALSSSHTTHTALSSSHTTHTALSSSHTTHTALSSSHTTHTALSSRHTTHTALSSSHTTHTALSILIDRTTHPLSIRLIVNSWIGGKHHPHSHPNLISSNRIL